MKKSKKKLLIIGCALLTILIIAIYIIIWEIQHPIVTNVCCEESIAKFDSYVLNREYFITDFSEFEYIGRESDKKDNDLYVIKENDIPVLLISYANYDDNTRYYINPTYTIPVSGKITKIYIDPCGGSQNQKTIYSPEDIDFVERITKLDDTEKLYNIDNFYTCGNEFYLAFNNCPASTNKNIGGYIAYTDGKYIYFSPKNRSNMLINHENNSCEGYGIEITDKELLKWLPDSILTDYIEE